MPDATRSKLFEAMAAFGVVWVFAAMTLSLMLPYVASYMHLALTAEDRAMANAIVSAINNAFVWVLGFLYGQSLGSRQKDQTIATQATTTAQAIAGTTNGATTPDKTVEIKPNETVAVTAAPKNGTPSANP